MLQTAELDLCRILDSAKAFHGHLGPFLAIGVRAGLIGLQKMKLDEGFQKLATTVTLEYKTPYSCIIDGVQISTRCTTGNGGLRIENRDGDGIHILFEDKENNQLKLSVNPSLLKKLQCELTEPKDREKLETLAHQVASMREDELFVFNLPPISC